MHLSALLQQKTFKVSHSSHSGLQITSCMDECNGQGYTQDDKYYAVLSTSSDT